MVVAKEKVDSASKFKLPFITAPQLKTESIGDECLGYVSIPKYGGLTVEEHDFIKENSINEQDIALKLAAEISSGDESQNQIMIANKFLTSDFDFLKNHLAQILKYHKQVEEMKLRNLFVVATAIIKFRICEGWTLEDTHNPEEIKPGLVKLIANFGLSEKGWKLDTEQAESE